MITELKHEAEAVKLTERRACSDFRVGWLSTLLDLDKKGVYTTAILATGDRYRSTRIGYIPRAGHIYVSIWASPPDSSLL